MVKKANQPVGIIRKRVERRAGKTGSQWGVCPPCCPCTAWPSCLQEMLEQETGRCWRQERVQRRSSEHLEVHMASLQETALQDKAHHPGRGQGGQSRGLVAHCLIPHESRTGPREVTTCQVQRKPNRVILLSHGVPLPRLLHAAKLDLASRSCQRNCWKKTTPRMRDHRDSEPGAGVLCQEEEELNSSILREGSCSLESTSGWVQPWQGW